VLSKRAEMEWQREISGLVSKRGGSGRPLSIGKRRLATILRENFRFRVFFCGLNFLPSLCLLCTLVFIGEVWLDQKHVSPSTLSLFIF
jgi:hypothetical protein